MFKNPHDIMLYRERTEGQEFGLAKKNYLLCPVCLAIYHEKSWHHRLDGAAAGLEGKKLAFKLCPACDMIAARQYEGRLIIENVPARLQGELFNLIQSFSRKAYEKDCQHRLIAITRNGHGNWLVTTTENQLATKLGKKIGEVFNGTDVKISYSRQPDDVERIKINFKPLTERL